MKLFKFWRKPNKKSDFHIYHNNFFYNKAFKFYSLTETDLPTNDELNTNSDSGYTEIVRIRPRFRNPTDPLPTIPINHKVTYVKLKFGNHHTYSNLKNAATSKKLENIYEDIPIVPEDANFLSSKQALSDHIATSSQHEEHIVRTPLQKNHAV